MGRKGQSLTLESHVRIHACMRGKAGIEADRWKAEGRQTDRKSVFVRMRGQRRSEGGRGGSAVGRQSVFVNADKYKCSAIFNMAMVPTTLKIPRACILLLTLVRRTK